MRRFLSLLLIVSLLIVPMQHLLAAPGAIQGGITTSVSGEHDHAAHHPGAFTTEHQYSDTEKQSDTPCQSGKSCKFCLSLAIIVTNQSSQDVVLPGGYVESLSYFQSTPLFPELRPPRQA